MAKKSTYMCSSCGNKTIGFYGKCPACGQMGTMEEMEPEVKGGSAPKSLMGIKSREDTIEPLKSVSKNAVFRISSGMNEFDRVVGGGIVSDSVNIISAPPGMGKSTLLLEVANNIAEKYGVVLYISGEESKSQLKDRADRILPFISDNLFVREESMIENILVDIKTMSPVFVIVDSVQTLYSKDCDGVLGGEKQALTCVNTLISEAKSKSKSKESFAIFLVGQMTKDDELRGSREVEHAVDAIFYLDKISNSPVRMLRSTKNRFGNIDEVGMFEMVGEGLLEIKDPAHYFTSLHNCPEIGIALSAIKEGTRNIIVEIEALCENNTFSFPQRVSNGISNDQLKLLIAIIERELGLKMAKRDVYTQICGGLKIKTATINLALCTAIYSVYMNKEIPQDAIFLGEVGLTGYLKKVPDIDSMIKDCERFGFKTIYIPKANLPLKSTSKINIISIDKLGELKKYI